jgi:hypothetical protein
MKFLGLEFKSKTHILYVFFFSSISITLLGWFLYHFSQFIYGLFMYSPLKFLGILLMPWVGIFILMFFVWILENEIIRNILKFIVFILLAFIVSMWFGDITPR